MTQSRSTLETDVCGISRIITPKVAIDLIERGNIRGLAKAITLVENGGEEKEILLDYAYKKKTEPTLVVGITGPGGGGKSTLIDQLIKEYRALGKTVGVIAVDPSSPYTGGAFLGDRVRMGAHNTDDGVYIRSFASRNSLGGISDAVKGGLYLYKAFHFDVIIVESIGVGQDQTEISSFVDVTVVVLVPGFGDAMQMAKAGIKEAADVFIINKSDRPEAAILKEQIVNSFGIMRLENRPPIVSTVASEGIGINEAISVIEETAEKQKTFADKKRRERIWAEISSLVMNIFHKELEERIRVMVEIVCEGSLTPYEASRKIIGCIEFRDT